MPAHVAVQLRSGVQVYGHNAEILAGRPEKAPAADERHFIFGTGLNINQGALKDIRFEGLNFDFRDEFGPVHRPTYAFGVTGVDDFQRHDMVIRSTGKLGGRGLLAENMRRRTDRNIKMVNIEQGIYTHYEYGVTMDNIELDTFNEGLDFDGPAWDVNLSRLKFRNAYGEAQCIDTGGGARWMVSDIDAENVGAIIFIYNKAISWPTYREWLDAFSNGEERLTSDFVIPEKMTIRSVRGSNVGKGGNNGKGAGKEEALRIGSYRTKSMGKQFGPRPAPSPRDITIEDWQLDNSYRIGINDCENLTMRNIVLKDAKVPDDSEIGAALVLREADAELGGSVTGQVSDVRINNSEGMGVSVVAGRGLKLKGITVNGYNRGAGRDTDAGIRLRHRRGGSNLLAQTENLSAQGGQTGDRPIDVSAVAPIEALKEKKPANNKRSAVKEQKKPKKVVPTY